MCVRAYTCPCVARESRVPCMLSMYSATKIDPLVPPKCILAMLPHPKDDCYVFCWVPY